MSSTVCPGCAVALPETTWPAPDGFRASAACWERYGELAGYTLSARDPSFCHQYAVDAYGAQHGGSPSKPIATFFALVGLYLACEHGLSGRAVQRAHMALARTKRDWPSFPPPPAPGKITVVDALTAAPRGLVAALMPWAESVWAACDSQKEVRKLVAAWLPGDVKSFERPR